MEILAATEPAQLDQWRSEFMRDCIEPIILPKALPCCSSTARRATSW